MLEFQAPEVGDEILFEAVLEPTAPAVKLAKGKGLGKGEIKAIRDTKKNKVSVGVPYYENLVSRLTAKKKEIPHEVKQMIEDYDFHFVSLSCSFLPDTGCKFAWARFGVELSARSQSGTLHEEKPIAFDMFPDEVLSATKCKKVIKIAPELKFSLGPIKVGSELVDVSMQREYIVYEPQIFAFGVNTAQVVWDFKSTKERGVWGNKRDLLLIVKTRKGSMVKGRFILSAEVGCKIAKWIPIPISKKKEKAVEVEYDLSK